MVVIVSDGLNLLQIPYIIPQVLFMKNDMQICKPTLPEQRFAVFTYFTFLVLFFMSIQAEQIIEKPLCIL